MKKVMFVTSNKILIEMVTSVLCARADIDFLLLSTSRYSDVMNDIALFGAEIVVIDAMDFHQNAELLKVCREISHIGDKTYKCVMFINSNEKEKHLAAKTRQEKIADDYIFIEDSPDHIFDRLLEV